MILKVDNQEQTLVQVTDSDTGSVMGLYLVPNKISITEFEQELQKAESQEDFDESNELGVQRVYAYDSILELPF